MCSIWSQGQSVANFLLSVGSVPSQLDAPLSKWGRSAAECHQVKCWFLPANLLRPPGKMSPVKPILPSSITGQMTVLAASGSLTLCLQLKRQVCLQVYLHRWHALTTLSSKVNGFYLKLFYLIYSFLRLLFCHLDWVFFRNSVYQSKRIEKAWRQVTQ